MIPSPWEFVLLVLAAYRLTRLGGWDEFPLAARVRAWVIGERWTLAEPVGRIESLERDPETGALVVEGTLTTAGAERLGLPGKQPHSELEDVRPAYDRPTLAHLVHCPFCLGWWVSLAVWGSWSLAGHWALVAAAPFAISGAVGLIAKNLDA